MTRAAFLVWHRRVALVFAPLLLLQALTGAALVFKGPLARAFDPAAMTRTGPGIAPVSLLAAQAADAVPGARVTRIFFPASPQDIALAEIDGGASYAALDPGSGAVLRSGSVWRFPLEAALQLHYRLMDGRLGMALVLANGLALALLAATGLKHWWPGRGRVVKGLKINRRAPGRVRLRQWHRSGGVLASLLVLFSATTGVLLAAPDLLDAPAAPAPVPPRTPAQIDRAVASARAAFPGRSVRDVRFPAAELIRVNLLAPDRNARAVHVVSVRLSDGAVLDALPARDNPALWMKVLSLHTGDSFGLTGRLLLLGEALVLAALALSGPWMWWRARRLHR